MFTLIPYPFTKIVCSFLNCSRSHVVVVVAVFSSSCFITLSLFIFLRCCYRCHCIVIFSVFFCPHTSHRRAIATIELSSFSTHCELKQREWNKNILKKSTKLKKIVVVHSRQFEIGCKFCCSFARIDTKRDALNLLYK